MANSQLPPMEVSAVFHGGGRYCVRVTVTQDLDRPCYEVDFANKEDSRGLSRDDAVGIARAIDAAIRSEETLWRWINGARLAVSYEKPAEDPRG